MTTRGEEKIALDLVNALQRAMARAIDLVTNERMHHFLCIRSIYMASNLEGLFLLAWAGPAKTLDDHTKKTLQKWYADIKTYEDVSSRERKLDFETVKRRTIICLADLAENYVETLIATYKRYLDDTGEVTRILSGRKPKDIRDPRDVRRSVRSWERSIPNERRVKRFEEMIQFYMPNFSMPSECESALDDLFKTRNALTHELILIGDLHDTRHVSATAAGVPIDQIEAYFRAVEELIMSSMKALRTRNKAA
ncbi:MAG: hypothetical protein KF780_08830 [Sphingomonas sp.]|nr:hypothetical protein [Sphingomonas sp.]